MQLVLSLEELRSFFKNNPFGMPTFFEQNRIDKKYDAFLIYHKVKDVPTYADDSMYFGTILFNFSLYTKTAKKRDEISNWLKKELDVPFDYNKEDFYYVATAQKELIINE